MVCFCSKNLILKSEENAENVVNKNIMIQTRFFPTPMIPPNLVRSVSGSICKVETLLWIILWKSI